MVLSMVFISVARIMAAVIAIRLAMSLCVVIARACAPRRRRAQVRAGLIEIKDGAAASRTLPLSPRTQAPLRRDAGKRSRAHDPWSASYVSEGACASVRPVSLGRNEMAGLGANRQDVTL
jgi:hypothetical protein